MIERPLLRRIIDPELSERARNQATREYIDFCRKNVDYMTGKVLAYGNYSYQEAYTIVLNAMIEGIYAYDKKINDKYGPAIQIWNKPRGWVWRIAIRGDVFRQQQEQNALLFEPINEDELDIEAQSLDADLGIDIQDLPIQQLRTISLRIIQNRGVQETARIMDVPVAQVREWHDSALRRLKQSYDLE